MPIVDGREALRQIKANEKLKKFPVYILSTTGDESQIKAVMKEGAKKFYSKPHNMIDYDLIIKEICNELRQSD